jgi:malonyl-CoA O-methyltransferase
LADSKQGQQDNYPLFHTNFMRQETIEISKHFSRRATHYQNHALIQIHSAKQLVSDAMPYLNPEQKLLDLGSGTGAIAHYLPKAYHKNLTMFDCAANMLSIAQQCFPDSTVVQGDFHALAESLSSKGKDGRRNKYDSIFANMSLHWSPDLALVLKQISKVMRPNGRLHFTMPTKDSFQTIQALNSKLKHKLTLNRLSSKAQVNAALTASGLKVTNYLERSYTETFTSLFELLKHFKANGVNYKFNAVSTPLTKADYNYLMQVKDEITKLDWQILFVTASL